jgi:RNA polymerase sigma factor (sigma-70 family)
MAGYEDASDAALILAAADDADAFRELYQRYSERLNGFFVRRGISRDGAVDLVAETFAQAWTSRRRFRDLAGGSAGPWLFTIARRVLIASVQRGTLERRALERLSVDWPVSEQGVDASVLDGLDADLEAALRDLPEAHRQALELRVLDGLAYATVADRLSCSALAARIRVSRGLARLRTQLEGNG